MLAFVTVRTPESYVYFNFNGKLEHIQKIYKLIKFL